MVFFVSLTTLLTLSFLFSAYTRPHITEEQEEFIRRVLEIPLEERKCRDLITLDTIHLYCGGPEPSAETRRLEEFSRRREYISPWLFWLSPSVVLTTLVLSKWNLLSKGSEPLLPVRKQRSRPRRQGGRRRQPLRPLPGRRRGSLTGVIAVRLKRPPSLPVP